MVPTILAVFANDLSKTLSLTVERDELERTFNDRNKVELEICDNATLDSVNRRILDKALQEKIVVFHYAGHAGGSNISLVSGEASADALALLLKQLTNLQLIFLNGCDTFSLTEQIEKAGITVPIITTLHPVNDQIATDFASYFYYAYYRLNDLSSSFQSAEARIIGKYGVESNKFHKTGRAVHQGGQPPESLNITNTDTVYALSAVDEELFKRTFLFNINYVEPNPTEINYQPYRNLIMQMVGSILEVADGTPTARTTRELQDLQVSYDNYKQKRSNRDFSYLVRDVLTVLPHPIGYHVRKLTEIAVSDWNGMDESKRIEFLKRLVITYNSLIRVLSFAMLSSFWNELKANETLTIDANQWKVLDHFIDSDQANNQDINYPALLGTIRSIFAANPIQPFISEYQELQQIFNTEDSFFQVHLHMQGIVNVIAKGEIRKLNIPWLCQKTEEMLANIFSRSGFVVRYKLSTVKQIEITKSRLKGPSYYIQRIILDRETVDEDDIAICDAFTDTRSVILAKGDTIGTFTNYLALSPFIIDENAQKDEKLSRLFFYSHAEGDKFVYRLSQEPDEVLKIGKDTYTNIPGKAAEDIEVVNVRMEGIKEEMDDFRKLIKRLNPAYANHQ